MRRIIRTVATLVVSGGVALSAGADKVANSDTGFFKDAAIAGAAEIKLSQYAVDHATRSDVKEFARMLLDEHAKAGSELSSLASEKNVETRPDPYNEAQTVHDRLAQLSGPAYDAAYVKEMVRAHERAVELFLKESITGLDPEAKTWATGVLPTLQRHLARARELASVPVE